MAEAIDIRELNIRIEQQSQFVTNLVMGMNKVIVGQKHLVDCLLIGLLSDGHILLEGVPGLAKTLAIKTLSQLISSDYSRIQFTPDLLPADVMLVPHHGSQTSSSPALLDAVQPHWAIAQAGYRNRFHHPAAVVMQRYADRHIPLRTTAECGAATWQSDQPLALACERQLRPRYWQHRMGGVPATPQSGAFPALPASSAPEVIEDVNAVPVSDEG